MATERPAATDVRVYPRALSPAEVELAYRYGTPTTLEDLAVLRQQNLISATTLLRAIAGTTEAADQESLTMTTENQPEQDEQDEQDAVLVPPEVEAAVASLVASALTDQRSPAWLALAAGPYARRHTAESADESPASSHTGPSPIAESFRSLMQNQTTQPSVSAVWSPPVPLPVQEDTRGLFRLLAIELQTANWDRDLIRLFTDLTRRHSEELAAARTARALAGAADLATATPAAVVPVPTQSSPPEALLRAGGPDRYREYRQLAAENDSLYRSLGVPTAVLNASVNRNGDQFSESAMRAAMERFLAASHTRRPDRDVPDNPQTAETSATNTQPSPGRFRRLFSRPTPENQSEPTTDPSIIPAKAETTPAQDAE